MTIWGDNLICVLSKSSQQGGVSSHCSMGFVSTAAGPHCTDGLGLAEPAPGARVGGVGPHK